MCAYITEISIENFSTIFNMTDRVQYLLYVYEKCVNERVSFISILSQLLGNDIIDSNTSEDLTSTYDQNKTGKTVAVLKILHHLTFLNDFILISININKWAILLETIREIKKKAYATINLPSYSPNLKIKISDIQASVDIIKISKTNLFVENREDSLHNYENFHKIMQEGFRKMVIRGKPGIGKTVQFKYLTYLWANKQWNNSENKLLLNLKLKDIQSKEDIYDALIRENFQDTLLTKDLLKFLMKEANENFILFMDGADELKCNHSSLKNIIEMPDPFVKTVIWTRNWKSREIISDLLYELKGFNKQQLKEFLSKCCSDYNGTELFLRKLDSSSQQVKKLCEIPLLALNLYILYVQEKDILEKNKCEIYSNIIELVCKNTKSLDKKLMKKLTRESYLQLKNNKITCYFNENDLKAVKDSLGKILEIFQLSNVYGLNTEIEFYHLSFQEYFAANYIIQKFSKEHFSWNEIDIFFSKVSIKNIFNMLDFIKDHSKDLFENILLKSSFVKNAYKLDNAFLCMLKNENICTRIDLRETITC